MEDNNIDDAYTSDYRLQICDETAMVRLSHCHSVPDIVL